ncbi:FAD-dependent oxidoreductase [Clostridium sp. ZBS17]|uniref:FAD-dependent oxidoreductase n=1 Tax=Clostridium sp. ZBS17 TaxID=2949968 RepID=UPI00207A80B1|nr:FAD-dependent oxidoreductase [Clostridium sp. ZBS17]
MKKVVIVGAGIAGLTTAYELVKKGEYDVIIVERDNAVGGLSRTYKYGEFAYDSGPHRFYTKNPKVISFIKDVLKEDFLSMKMTSSVYILGKYYNWPLGIKVILKLPFKVMIGAGIDMICLMFKKNKEVVNFKEHILQKYGKTLFDIDFDPYTNKFTKISTDQIHADWAKAGVNRAVIDEKVKMDSIFAVVKNTLFPQKENITIMYPKNGIYEFSENLKKMIEDKGGNIILNSKPIKLNLENKKITGMMLDNKETISNIDHVVWTGSINEAAKLVGSKERELEYLNIITYNVSIKGKPKLPYQWIYYVDKNIVFNRLYNTVKFSTNKAPKECYGLCLEVTCRNSSDLINNPESLYEQIISDIKKVKLIENENEIVKINHQLLYQAYPMYKTNYRGELRKIFDDIYNDAYNFTLAGRNGLFWYNNMDHSIENAFDTADNIINNKRNIAINEFWK